MRIVENFIRCNAGKNAIPKNYREHAIQKGKILKDIYKIGSHLFDVEGKSEVKKIRPFVYADCEQILEDVVDYRNLIGNYYIKVMADSGQEFFKISMSVFTKNGDENDANNTVRRSTYSAGGKTGRSAPLTSVRRIVMLCVVPKIKESYDNRFYLCNLIKLNNIPFKFACDLKLLLTVNGQQTACAKYPCPYCLISLRNLKKGCKELDENSDSFVVSTSKLSSKQENVVDQLKSYGDLEEDHEKYVLHSESKKHAMNFHSMVNKPIFQEKNDFKVIEKCIVPELHLLQGFPNHLFWKGCYI